ncbi:dihydrofolate reductase family protein, partial [Francisella tularensis subsp. holarctica]|uniref:dihydrofolate reductase family protein n=1 Tax=Francisella tularensis TaxID=263 RepID=UPI002381CDD5
RVATKINQLGSEYWLLPQSHHQVCLETLLEKMGKIGITSLLVEGGNKPLNSFINQKLVNEFYTYLAPVIISDYNPNQKLSYNQISVRD